MEQLNQQTLVNSTGKATDQKRNIFWQNYDRDSIQPGIVHFGVGNFHRSHQAVYIDKLLSMGDLNWGIVGVSMRSAKIRDALQAQDFLYTEVTLGEQTEFNIIGSIVNILVAPECPDAVINQVADSNIKLVSVTITEKGYCLSSDKINSDHPDMAADSTCLKNPQSIYGYLAAAIIKRSNDNGAPLNILCCDNIQTGGAKLRAGVHMLLQRHAQDALEWTEKNVSFVSSMVDRVTPATDNTLKQLVNSTLQLEDAWPVSAEPFSQWVIEDKFTDGRPALDKVGVLFAGDISLYEQMKLRFLNAGHSIISVLGYLDQRQTIHEALQQPCILKFAQKALYETLLPITEIPLNSRGEDYIADVLKRFQNSALPYTVQQVNSDSSQKIQQRWFPSIDHALMKNANTKLMSFTVAAWVIYIEQALDAGELNDPLSDDLLVAYENNRETVQQFLVIAGANRFSFINSIAFMTDTLQAYKTLKHANIISAINEFLSKPLLRPKDLSHA